MMFCRKNKKYYFAKKWGCHGTCGTPGVDGPMVVVISIFRTDLMSVITLCKVKIVSIGKKSYESTLIFA